MTEKKVRWDDLRALTNGLEITRDTCSCHYEKYLAWDRIDPDDAKSMVLKGIMVNPADQTGATTNEYPGPYNYWAADAPMALGYYPYNGSEIFQCSICNRLFFVYMEFAGHIPETRCRLLKKELLVYEFPE